MLEMFARHIYLFCCCNRTERSDYKTEPSKMKSVSGWLIQMGEDPVHPDSFHIAHPATGNMHT